MKDYSALKREIQTYIRTNNNQEITGEVLQNVLVSIVSNVGENAGFGGIAKKTTSPGTPDGPVFYFATEQGVYPNFGGLEIERENTLNIIYNTEDGWDALFLGNLVPNEEVEDFRTFKHLENMRFEQASEYCATFDNIIEKIGDGSIRFSRPVIFTFSYLSTEQGMIINLPSSNRIITQFAFTEGRVNYGFSRRLIQYDASLTITNVGEWKPISSLIPAATTSAAGLMSADDKVKLGNSVKGVLSNRSDGTLRLSIERHNGMSSLTTLPNAVSEVNGTPAAGIMSIADKEVLGNTGDINVGSLPDNGIDAYTTRGTYRVHGERTNANDGLPILNSNPGNTVEGILKVLDSSISGSGQPTDKVVTQILTMSNRIGGDGHIWVRTGQGSSILNLTWSTWEKMQGIFEKNNVTTLEYLDGYTTNGMYSGIYAGTEPKNFYTVQFLPLDTFLMITVNGYAVSKLAVPQITQLLYKLPAKTSTSKQNAEIYLRTGSYNKTDKVWDWGTFTKMITNADLSAQVATLTAKINQKQDALTLTVKDNGNIVLANIQGQSKEFMPATPSGDPMHYAYVTAGAEYNDTGADIVKDAPWADLADDDADKTVVHKAGYWYLNGLGDITNEQMRRIYMLTGSNQNYWIHYCDGQDFRTNIMTMDENSDVPVNLFSFNSGLRRCTIEVLRIPTSYTYEFLELYVPYYNLIYAEKLKFIIGTFKATEIIKPDLGKLKVIKIYGIYTSANFTTSKELSMKSVLYMINNEAATSPITITLHADVYNRCMANEDILAALEAHTNISIASA